MTRLLAIFAALTCAASAQTYRTVTADTNNAIRTNFTLGAAQVSGSFAISNVTGLQSALDGKLETNGSAAGLTNFPALLLTTNSSASAFPSDLLRTNGDGSGLTNLPNADLGSATGILPLANGGTGATNASEARTALELGTAATNDATAFQPASTNLTALASGDGSSLTNVTITDASTLTNFPSELLRTNGDGSGLTGIAVYPALSNNAGLVLAVTTNETGVEWIAVSNTVTDAASLTNYPAYLLQTNGDAAGLTNFPTFNQNTTGTASNVTGIVEITNGGTGTNSAAGARVNLLPSYTGNSNKVLAVNAGETDVEWVAQSGGGGGTIDLSTTNATGVLPITKGGSGATSAVGALTNFTILNNVAGVRIGTVNTTGFGVAIGAGATNEGRGAAIGEGAVARQGGGTGAGAVGYDAQATDGGFAGGNASRATAGGGIGRGANTTIGGAVGHDAVSVQGGAMGRLATATNGGAIGVSAKAINGFAGGANAQATATNASQLGAGTNATDNTLQFMSAGTVDTNEWARIAALSTYPTTNISVVGTNNTNTLVFSNGILVEVQ